MSDIYLVPPVPAKAGKNDATVQWVNTGTVFQHILHQLDAAERRLIVLRCDELPHLQGTEEGIRFIFSSLLRMILQNKISVNQLFLHINCKTALQEPESRSGSLYYVIQFNTNVTLCTDWMQVNKTLIDEIQTVLQQYNGSLQIAESQGCIFSLSLPGKTL